LISQGHIKLAPCDPTEYPNYGTYAEGWDTNYMKKISVEDLRSRKWFMNKDNPEMTALYLERYLNYGLTREELQSGKPIIAIAQTGSDLSPCNRHHIELTKRVRDGIIAAGGTPIEVPVHPIQETGKRPTASLDRNLAYLSLVETLFGYPLDGVVLNIGCDKTTPALLMAAGTVNIPAIALSVGPMLNGWWKGERAGSGTSAPSVGYCNTMGTATTMNSLAEALGMQLPGSAAIPAPYRERGQIAYETGKRIVEWQKLGHDIPLLVNLQPAGKYLGEDYQQAGGVPAVVGELLEAGLLPHPDAVTVNGASMGDNCKSARSSNTDVILTVAAPLMAQAGFINLSGNLFDSAIMKTSVISEDFRARYLSDENDPMAFEGIAVVYDGPEDFHHRVDDEKEGVTEKHVMFMRGAGPKGYPGGAEVVNMRPPSYLLKKGIQALPCIGDGRQSGTSGSPSILNASPEAADGGGLALLQNGDPVRVDLNACTVNMLVPLEELQERAAKLAAAGGYDHPESQTPWQQYFRELVGRFDEGMTLRDAETYQDISRKFLPRDSH